MSVYRTDTGLYLCVYRSLLLNTPEASASNEGTHHRLYLPHHHHYLSLLRASCTCIRSYRRSHAPSLNYSKTPRKSILVKTDRTFLMHIHLDDWRRAMPFSIVSDRFTAIQWRDNNFLSFCLRSFVVN